MNKKDNKGKHLTLEERMTILNELIKGTKLSDISNKICNTQLLFQKKLNFIGIVSLWTKERMILILRQSVWPSKEPE